MNPTTITAHGRDFNHASEDSCRQHHHRIFRLTDRCAPGLEQEHPTAAPYGCGFPDWLRVRGPLGRAGSALDSLRVGVAREILK